MALSHQTESCRVLLFPGRRVSQKQTTPTGATQKFSGNLSQDEWGEEGPFGNKTGRGTVQETAEILRGVGWFGGLPKLP